MNLQFSLYLLLSLLSLTLASPLTITDIEERGFLSQLNKFYIYLHFNNPIDSLLSDYSVHLLLSNSSCIQQTKLFSSSRIVALRCQYQSSYQSPLLSLQFENQVPPQYLVPNQYHHKTRNLYHIPQQYLVQNYYLFTYTISQWIGYLLLLLFLMNFITYFLPLLRIIQLTSLFLILDIEKPKIFDVVLFGLFNFNKYRLYEITLTTPFNLVVEPKEYTVFSELGVSPVFIGEQYSFLMQLCFLMMGVFVMYAVCSVVLMFCKVGCVRYFIKRFIKDIFINTSSLYFMMHIPLGLTALIGIRFGNHILAWKDIVEYGVNIVGVGVLWMSPGLYAALLGVFKYDGSVYLKRCHLFGARRRRFAEVYVGVELMKDVLFVSGAVLFPKQYALILMMVLVVVELWVIGKTNVFGSRAVYYLKIVEQIFLLFYTILFVVFYVIEEMRKQAQFDFGLDNHMILGYIGISLLGAICFIVITEIILQIIYDYCHKCKCRRSAEPSIDNLEHDELYMDQYTLTHQKVKQLKSVRKEKEKIMHKRVGRLEDVNLFMDQSAVHLKKHNELLTVPNDENVDNSDIKSSGSGKSKRTSKKDRRMSCEIKLDSFLNGISKSQINTSRERQRNDTLEDQYNNQSKQGIKSKASLFKTNNKLKAQINNIYESLGNQRNQDSSSHYHIKQQKLEQNNRSHSSKRPATSKNHNNNKTQKSHHKQITSKQAIEQISSGEISEGEQLNIPPDSKSYYIGNKLNLTDLSIGGKSSASQSERNQSSPRINKPRLNRKGITSRFKDTQ